MQTIEFRSESTGEIIDTFQVSDDEFELWTRAAERAGISIEEFLVQAIELAAGLE